jgi:membrane-associated protease RseP (regulator of RpoE activity)
LWSFRRGETEYGIKALPAGGFVKIEGMTALEEIAPEDENRAFYKQPAPQRVVVLAAGSVVHFIIAIVLVFGVLAVSGQDPVRTQGLSVAAVEQCVPSASSGVCQAGDPTAPALHKLQKGDKLLAINGVATDSDGTNLITILHGSAGEPLAITVLRDGQRKTFVMTPVASTVGGQTVGRIGIENLLIPAHVGVLAAVPRTFTLLGDYVKSTGSAITGLPHELAGIIEGKPRQPNGAAGVIDIARVSGQITASHASVGEVIATLLLIIASLNLFVGIFNLLPLLPLDGGHIAILLYEEARSGVYRLFRRPDPGRVDILKVLPLTYAVMAAFVGLSLILLYAGIANPIRLQ